MHCAWLGKGHPVFGFSSVEYFQGLKGAFKAKKGAVLDTIPVNSKSLT